MGPGRDPVGRGDIPRFSKIRLPAEPTSKEPVPNRSQEGELEKHHNAPAKYRWDIR